MVGVPVFTRRAVEDFTPPGSGRTYQIAPLTYRERQAFTADMAISGGIFPLLDTMMEAVRAELRTLAPSNLAELLGIIDAYEATPGDADAKAAMNALDARCAQFPGYAALIAARHRYAGMLPWVAARHALRGWSGPGLPPFRRERGLVPEDLLDLVPEHEMRAIGNYAADLMQPGPSAEKNSAPPSMSSEAAEPMAEGSPVQTEAHGG